MKRHYIYAILLVLFSSAVQAKVLKENLLFTAKLQANGISSSKAKGIATFSLNKKRDSMSVNIVVVGTLPTSIGLYQGKAGAIGPLVKDLSTALSGNLLSTVLTKDDLHISKFLNNELYVVIGSDSYPAGEIKGNIVLEANYNFKADMSAKQTVPLVNNSAEGLGSFTLSMDKSKLDFKIICSKLSGPIKSIFLGIGKTGEEGIEEISLNGFIKDNIIRGSISINTAVLNNLLNSSVFINVTTTQFPKGEIRSPLILQKGIVLEGYATGNQMIPKVSTPAEALCMIRLSPTLDTLYYDALVNGLTTSIDYSHLHVGYEGVAYDDLQVDFTTSIKGNRIAGFKKGSQVNSTTISKLLTGNLSLIVHSKKYPMGEVRGQVYKLAYEGYSAYMDVTQNVHHAHSEAFGYGIVSVSPDDSNAHIIWAADNFSTQITSAHLHEGAKGVNGNVLFDLDEGMEKVDNFVFGDSHWTIKSTTPYSKAMTDLFNKNSVYINIHTEENPDGDIRGQMQVGPLIFPKSTSVNDASDNGLNFHLKGNPVIDQVNVIIEENYKNLIYSIYDEMGRMAAQGNVDSPNGLSIDVSSLEPGIYTLHLSNPTLHKGIKFLKI